MGNILLGLIPALTWGIQPVIMTKIGGKPSNQQMGMVMGTMLFAIIVFIFRRPEEWTPNLVISCILCGLIWSFGQINQIKSFPMIGVSRAVPISTGTQLIGTSLVGVLYFREWDTTMKLVMGFSAIIVIIVGVSFTAFQERKGRENEQLLDMKRGIITLLMSSAAFVCYAVIPRVAGINGWDALFPQAIAMFAGTVFFCKMEKDTNIWGRKSFQNILTGFAFAIANLTVMLSNERNGVAVGFTLSQMNVIVATLGGLLILRETKTKLELKYILGGLLLVACGGIVIGLTKL